MAETKPRPAAEPHRARITVEVEPEVRQSLAQWADEEDRSISAQIRRLIVKGLQGRQQEAA
jgi:hypothetical protein